MTSRLTTIYRSPKEEGLYLYVDKIDDLSRVPDELLKHFGKPQLAMTLLINNKRKLARADAEQVLLSVENKGFYLQLPPSKETLLK